MGLAQFVEISFNSRLYQNKKSDNVQDKRTNLDSEMENSSRFRALTSEQIADSQSDALIVLFT